MVDRRRKNTGRKYIIPYKRANKEKLTSKLAQDKTRQVTCEMCGAALPLADAAFRKEGTRVWYECPPCYAVHHPPRAIQDMQKPETRYSPQPASEAQVEYIKILSNYDSTKNEDAQDIHNFLEQLKRTTIESLSKGEAHKLIGILLARPVQYRFPCGRELQMTKQECNRCTVMGGDLEACLHWCDWEQ